MVEITKLTKFIVVTCIVSYGIAEDGYFWHVTDFHYDHSYNGDRLSCDKQHTPNNIGQFGTHWCDSPWLLVNSSVQAMADIHPNVDFLLWTGDTVLHTSDEHLNYSINAGILNTTTDALKKAFPGTSVYASFGNHDYYPTNQFPPFNNMLYNDSLLRWGDWINDSSQHKNILKGGYYTVKTTHGLRIVALNTNLYYKSNKAARNKSDPADQFAWLNETLKNATTAAEKVLITAHIPPGIFTPISILWMYEDFNTKLVNILQQHAGIIVGMHFGHDHSDAFRLMINTNGSPGAPMFIAPSVTPWKHIISAPDHNPGIRLVRYDRLTGKHLEIKQYYLDIETANRIGVADWIQEYNTSHVYKLTELTAASLASLIDKMKESKGIEFQGYWKHFTVSPRNLQPCDETCHATIICGYTHYDMASLDDCKQTMLSTAAFPTPMASLVAMLVGVAVVF